jgi:hypothetical protein
VQRQCVRDMPEALTLFQRIETQESRGLARSVPTNLPAGMEVCPTQMRPFMKVPVVSTTALHWNVMPKKVFTPAGYPTSMHRECQRRDILRTTEVPLQL